MKALITGGCGFIGSNLANFLSEKGDEVVALDDLSLGVEENLLEGKAKLVLGTVLNSELVDKFVKESDIVFHEAAKSSSPMFKDDPRYGIEVNLLGFMNVMQAAKKYNKKVVYASSSSVYNGLETPFHEGQTITPKTFYEAGFYARELIARSYFLEYGVKSIGLRYFSVYGKNEKHKGQYANNISQFLWSMKEGKSPIVYGDGSQTRDFTHVSDVVRANILAAHSDIDFGIYNIGTGVSYSFKDMIEILRKELRTNITVQYLVPNPIKNYVQDTKSDISKAFNHLGYNPTVTLEEGIKTII